MDWDRIFVACVTPYKPHSQERDEEGLRELLQYFLSLRDKGLSGIIMNPEAGDVFYLSREEKRRNVEIAKEELGEKLPVVAGTFGITTEETLQVARDAKEAGADGIFVLPPAGALDVTFAWNPVKYPEVWIDQIKAQDQIVDLPIITHPVGKLSLEYGEGLPTPLVLRMCTEIPNIVGWKMTYNYVGHTRVARALKSFTRHVAVLGAPAHLFHAAFSLGILDGVLTGSLNFSAEPILAHITAFRQGDFQKAKEIWDSGLGELQEYIYSDLGRLHVRYKLATWLRGLIKSPLMRPPMPPPTEQEKKDLTELLGKAGFDTPGR